MTFPLIYSNGCSYSDDNFQYPVMKDKTHSHYVGKLLNGFTINNSKSGSCNRRIIRSATHDLLLQRQQNPNQQIIALIQLTFELRDEIWIDDLSINSEHNEVESNFKSHQFSHVENWKELLLAGKDIMIGHNKESINKKFLKKWSEGRAFFYSPYAERINLLLDLLFFTNLLKSQGIDYLIFAGPTFEPLEEEHLKDFFKLQLQDPKILDLEKFSFCDWCAEREFNSVMANEPRNRGHYEPAAHQAFAEQVIVPKLKELGIVA